MVIDLVVALLVGVSLFRGWVRGFLFQLGQAAWALASFLVARTLGPSLEGTVIDLGAAEHMANTLAFCAVFVPVFAIGSFIIYRVTREFHESVKGLTSMDRFLGMTLGGLKGCLLVYIGFVVLIMSHRLGGHLPVPYATSASGRFVMENNFLDSDEFPRARALKAIVKLGYLTSTAGPAELIRDPHFRAILTHPKAECLRSQEIMGALIRQDWVAVLSNEEVWDLLDEPEIQEHLNAIEAQGSDQAQKPSFEDVPKFYLHPTDQTP
jgi:uncharacterized membrane protein required for colicin V production